MITVRLENLDTQRVVEITYGSENEVVARPFWRKSQGGIYGGNYAGPAYLHYKDYGCTSWARAYELAEREIWRLIDHGYKIVPLLANTTTGWRSKNDDEDLAQAILALHHVGFGLDRIAELLTVNIMDVERIVHSRKLSHEAAGKMAQRMLEMAASPKRRDRSFDWEA